MPEEDEEENMEVKNKITKKEKRIVEIYNGAIESHHPRAEWFAMHEGDFVIDCRYFTEEGLQALRDGGFEIKYLEAVSYKNKKSQVSAIIGDK